LPVDRPPALGATLAGAKAVRSAVKALGGLIVVRYRVPPDPESS